MGAGLVDIYDLKVCATVVTSFIANGVKKS